MLYTDIYYNKIVILMEKYVGNHKKMSSLVPKKTKTNKKVGVTRAKILCC